MQTRRWNNEKLWWCWIALAIAITLAFHFTDIDLWLASQFFRTGAPNHGWFLADNPLVVFLYQGTETITLVLLLCCITVIVLGLVFDYLRNWRALAVFVLATMLVGPGLLVNGVFKEHWGRPRPNDVQQFGGDFAFVPVGRFSAETSGISSSFPSGHASVGFAFLAFWAFYRRYKPVLARRFLYAALILGFSVGAARIVAGGHFLSDVIWAGMFCFLTCLLLQEVLPTASPLPPTDRIPLHETAD